MARKLKPDTEPELDFGPGQFLTVGGVQTEFFTIGVLARALNRKPTTIRPLEAEGQLPRPGWREPRVRGKGKQRLYTRPQIEAAVRIAAEEGILTETWRAVSKTNFRARVAAAWEELNR